MNPELLEILWRMIEAMERAYTPQGGGVFSYLDLQRVRELMPRRPTHPAYPRKTKS